MRFCVCISPPGPPPSLMLVTAQMQYWTSNSLLYEVPSAHLSIFFLHTLKLWQSTSLPYWQWTWLGALSRGKYFCHMCSKSHLCHGCFDLLQKSTTVEPLCILSKLHLFLKPAFQSPAEHHPPLSAYGWSYKYDWAAIKIIVLSDFSNSKLIFRYLCIQSFLRPLNELLQG